MNALGYFTPKEFQSKTVSRIIGGHSIVGIAPDGAGKTTSYILGVLMRLKYTEDEAPKVLVLAPNEERINEIVEQFITISGNKNLYIKGLKTSGGMEEEIEELVRGVDIVVATPNRARAVYLKLGLNLNRIETFIIDDADEIIKQGMQLAVTELARSCGDVQYLAFSTVDHDKLRLLIDDYMDLATTIEVEDLGEIEMDTHELMLYNVPNFTTKINLLNLLLQDEEVFDKSVVFVNSHVTAQKLAKSLHAAKGKVGILHPYFPGDEGTEDIEIFKNNPASRVLIIAHEGQHQYDLKGIPFIFNFEIPDDQDDFVKNALRSNEDDVISITFATDLELPELRKIEQTLGKKIPSIELPEDLVIFKPTSGSSKEKEKFDETQGGAFHKKKESNSKTYNYGGGQKAKMTKKNKKG